MAKLFVLSVLLAFLVSAQTPAASEKELEAAIHREIVLGDLNGAIDHYRAILSMPGTTRHIAARALLQVGECQEKLGRRGDADTTFRRVAGEYADQAEIAGLARTALESWSGPHNLTFQQGEPGKLPVGWQVPSFPKDVDYIAQLQRTGCRSNVGCATVVVSGTVPTPSGNEPLGNMMQRFSAAAYRGKTVRLRAWLKMQSFYSTGTGVHVPDKPGQDRGQMWVSVERPNRRTGFSDKMDDRPVRSSDWTRCEIVGAIDEDAEFIDIGFMSIGSGRVWVDDVTFEVIR